MMFDRLEVERPVPGAAPAVVIIGGAGGVGSIAIQLLHARTDLTVIATTSRPETADWCRRLGAHHVLDQGQPLAAQVEALGIGVPGFVFCTAESADYRDEVIGLLAPQGRFGFIDDPVVFDVIPFKGMSISVHMELIFTRSIFGTADIGRQGALLAEVAALIDSGKIRSTAAQLLGQISAATLTEAHRLIETGRIRGTSC
jgi:zinc-binding alcohol dehydrogenase family protein